MHLPVPPTRSLELTDALTRLSALWGQIIGQYIAPVQAPANLESLQVVAGTSTYVQSLKTSFTYDPTGNAALADGITLVASDYGGVWARDNTEDKSWVATTTFYVDFTNGLDTNAGTIGAPLKTLAEWHRRVPVVQTAMQVNIVDSDPSDPLPNNIEIASGASLNIQGTLGAPSNPPTKTGAIDVYTAANPVGGAQPIARIEDADADFTADVGKLIYIVEQSAWAVIVRGAAAFADISRPLTYLAGYAVVEATPVVTNTYQIYDRVPVFVAGSGLVPPRAALCVSAPAEAFAMTNLDITYAGGETTFEMDVSGKPLLVRCGLPDGTFIHGNAALFNVHANGDLDLHPNGSCEIFGLSGGNDNLNTWGVCTVYTGGVTWVGDTVRVQEGLLSVQGPIAVEDATEDGIVVYGGAVMDMTMQGSTSGANNGFYGLSIEPGGKVTGLIAGIAMTITGASGDLHVGGDDDLIPDMIGRIANAQALVVADCTSWTNFFPENPVVPYEFNGEALNHNNGAYIGP